MNTLPENQQEKELASSNFSKDFFARWIRYLDVKPRTLETYSKAVKPFFAYLNEKNIRNPQREDILAYRDFLKLKHKPATVQIYLTAVKLFFQWMEKEGIYPNVAGRVKGAAIHSSAHKKDCLTSRQAACLLNGIDRSSLRGLRDYAILALMTTTGLRAISIVTADIGDLGTAADNAVLYYRGKGFEEKPEYVKLAEPVENAVRIYLTARGETDSAAPLFGSIANRNNGRRLTTRSISRIVKTRLIAAGLQSDRLTAHSLRHTAATLNLLNGGSLEETQQLLNHSSINTTMIYAHALERVKNDSEKRIAEAIFGGEGSV